MKLFKKQSETLPLAVLVREGYSVFSLATKHSAFTVYTKEIEKAVDLLRAYMSTLPMPFHPKDETYVARKDGSDGYA